MNDRLAELLARARAGQLGPAETQELARLLNQPLLEPLEHPPPAFVSKHSFAPSDVAGRLRAVDWFSQCGRPASLGISMPFKQVVDWREAIDRSTSAVWQNAQLEAQNQLTLWLQLNDVKNYQRWNELASQHQASVINALLKESWVPYQRRHRLDIALVHSVQWDALAALMENSYLSSGHRSFFFLELLTVYEAGHFPCGWLGEWPQGKLLVY